MFKDLTHILICLSAYILIPMNGCFCCMAQSDTLHICFMGDMMMHANQISRAVKSDGGHDFDSYFSLISDKIHYADLAVANMEFTLAGEPYTGYPCFSAPDSFARHIADCGFNILLAANNHIFDKGCEGALRTLEVYRQLEHSHGTVFTGLAGDDEERADNTPLIISCKGIKVAFINFTYGTNLGCGAHWPKTNYQGEKEFLEKALAKAEDCADLTIVLPHWGPEYEMQHSEKQENTARWLIENGADMIIGTHPHVIQDTSVINDVQVVYSLGNAVSNMSAANTQLEYMADVRIVKDIKGETKILPVRLTWLWCSRPGGYGNGYIVVPIEEYINRKEEWTGQWDYDKMMNTYLSARNRNN